MTISPEIIAEQVMGYVVWATEMIPTLKPTSQPHSVAILPQGPHFYTGLLQAAGYLLLDGKKKKLIMISQQSDDEKNIVIDTTIYGPICGKMRETPMKILSKIKTAIGATYSTKEHKSLMDNVHFQMPFIHIITKTEELIHIGIGEKTSTTSLHKLIVWIKKNIQEYNIVLLTNIEISSSTKSRSDEHAQIAKYIQTSPTPLLTLFKKIGDIQKKKPEIIAYVHPQNFGKTTSLMTRYICAVG